MRPRPTILTVALAAAALALALAAPAGATTRHVAAGQSIQAAIDAAAPGDTIVVAPGRFHQNLTITKDRITLRGAGARETGTVLSLTSPVTPSPCTDPSDPGAVHGICVLGEVDFATGTTGRPVDGVTIEGLVVEGFSAFGVFAYNASDLTVTDTVVRNNSGYGISGFVLERVRLLDNVASDNSEPGFYIGDSPHAHAEVTGNTALRNGAPGGGEGFGIFVRDSSHGVVRDNVAADNCVGILLLDTGAPGPVRDWAIEDNEVRHNNRACPAGEEGAAVSGTGILLGGTRGVSVRDNEVEDHAPALESPFSGGIVVVSTTDLGGARPAGNAVTGNEAEDNRPYDVRWDRTGSGNAFRGNDCERSRPARICD
jgi:hypothetical protein